MRQRRLGIDDLTLRARFRDQEIEGGGDAALVERYARQVKAHLDAGQGSGQHEVVKVAQVPDAEGLAFESDPISLDTELA